MKILRKYDLSTRIYIKNVEELSKKLEIIKHIYIFCICGAPYYPQDKERKHVSFSHFRKMRKKI